MATELSGGVTVLDRPDGPDRENVQTAELQHFLEAYARALVAGDGRIIADLWETPALVVDDRGVVAVGASEEVSRFFSGAKRQYEKAGIVNTRPQIERLEWPTPRIGLARVRWPYLDAQGNEVGTEESTYTLRRDDGGKLRIRAVIMHGGTPRH